MTENPVFARIQSEIDSNDIVLFMKGSKKLPQCGFSATVAAVMERLGIADGDIVEVRSPLNETKGRVMLCEGIRPDTLLMIGQFDHWATPFAKDFHAPSMNALVPMLIDLTDATGSSADLVKVKITRLEKAA